MASARQGGQRAEDRGQKAGAYAVGGWRSASLEVGGSRQKTEDRRQKTKGIE